MADVQCDVLVVGGSLGGVAAAIRAAQMGATVCLLEDSGWVGGQLTAQGVCTPDETHLIESGCGPAAYLELRHQIRQYYKDHFQLSAAGASQAHFNPGDCWVGYLSVEPKVAHALLRSTLAGYSNLQVYLNTSVTRAETSNNTVNALVAVDAAGNEIRFTAAYFLDATDLGDLLPLTGVEHVIGADSRLVTGEPDAQDTAHPDWVQPITFPFALEHRPFGEDNTIPKPDEYDSLKAVQNYRIADGGIDGIFKGNHPWWTYRRIISAAQFSDPAFPYDISMINTGSNDFQGGIVPSGDPTGDAETLRRARLASLGYVYWLQTECPREDGQAGPGYPELRLRTDIFDTPDGLAPRPYVRESRRIKAVETVLEQEIVATFQLGDRAAVFPDACGIGSYWLDVHKGGTPDPEVFLDTKPFQIPLGALIPIRVTNLLPACKNIGVTHLTNGAYRLHPIEWNIGEAAGALAAFCLTHNVAPQEVQAQSTLLRAYQQVLLDAGNPIFWWSDVPAGHPAFVATQWLGMAGIFQGSAALQFSPDGPFTDAAKQIIEQRVGRSMPWPSQAMTRAQAAVWLYQLVGTEALAAGPTALALARAGALPMASQVIGPAKLAARVSLPASAPAAGPAVARAPIFTPANLQQQNDRPVATQGVQEKMIDRMFLASSSERDAYHKGMLLIKTRAGTSPVPGPTLATTEFSSVLLSPPIVAPGLQALATLERAGLIKRATPVSRTASEGIPAAAMFAAAAGAGPALGFPTVGASGTPSVLAALSAAAAVDTTQDSNAGVTLVEIDTTSTDLQTVQVALANDPSIEFVSPVPVRYLLARRLAGGQPLGAAVPAAIPPLATTLWNLDKIQWAQARNKQPFTDATSIKVAVLDTGVDVNHPDLAGRVSGYVFSHPTMPQASSDKDLIGHGTHVSGTIGALINNSLGINGICACQLYVWKIFADQEQYLPFEGYYTYTVEPVMYLRALADCLQQNVEVINLSIGGPGAPSAQEQQLFSRLLANNTTIVAAMGNDAQKGNPTSYPAAIPGVIAVGATSLDDSIADFSSYGNHISLSAPGKAIWSTIPTYSGQFGFRAILGPGGAVVRGTPIARETDYDAWDGTSMATPHVTASVALLFSNKGKQDPAAARQSLQTAADKVPGMAGAPFDAYYGAGRLNLYNLI